MDVSTHRHFYFVLKAKVVSNNNSKHDDFDDAFDDFLEEDFDESMLLVCMSSYKMFKKHHIPRRSILPF